MGEEGRDGGVAQVPAYAGMTEKGAGMTGGGGMTEAWTRSRGVRAAARALVDARCAAPPT